MGVAIAMRRLFDTCSYLQFELFVETISVTIPIVIHRMHEYATGYWLFLVVAPATLNTASPSRLNSHTIKPSGYFPYKPYSQPAVAPTDIAVGFDEFGMVSHI